MNIEDLQERYGLYLAEMVRQALTLEDFQNLDINELVAYFEKRSQQTYEAYRSKQKILPPEHGPIESQDDYHAILKRRWEEAEDLAYEVLKAEREACNREATALEA